MLSKTAEKALQESRKSSKKDKDKVHLSIITPCFNGEKYLNDCIQSVISQNCASVEHIIIDGGSSDNTLKILRRYSALHTHVRWISEQDKGQSDAMNKGIRMAKGNIVGILNVDDYYEPEVLNRILDYFKDLPEPGLLVGNCNVLNENEEVVFINQPKRLKIEELLLGDAINPHPVNPSAYFYHKSLHQRTGFYDINEHYVMDLDFILKAVQKGNVRYIDETWGNYRYIEGTKTFDDFNLGHGRKRKKELHKYYLGQLGLAQKTQVRTLRTLLTLRSSSFIHKIKKNILFDLVKK